MSRRQSQNSKVPANKVRYFTQLKEWERKLSASQKFLQDPECAKLFSDIAYRVKMSKIWKAELTTMRAELKKRMVNSKVVALYDCETGMSAHISESDGIYKRSVFNEELFKKENPELYKKYLVSTTGDRLSGTLTVKGISKDAQNAIEHRNKLESDNLVSFEIREQLSSVVMFNNYTIYSTCELSDLEKSGHTLDGIGYYLSKNKEDSQWSITDVAVDITKIDTENHTHVIWGTAKGVV